MLILFVRVIVLYLLVFFVIRSLIPSVFCVFLRLHRNAIPLAEHHRQNQLFCQCYP